MDGTNNVLVQCLDFCQSALTCSTLFAHKITNEVGSTSFIISARNRGGKSEIKKQGRVRMEGELQVFRHHEGNLFH